MGLIYWTSFFIQFSYSQKYFLTNLWRKCPWKLKIDLSFWKKYSWQGFIIINYVTLASCVEGASLALVDDPWNCGVTMGPIMRWMFCCINHSCTPSFIFGWLKLNCEMEVWLCSYFRWCKFSLFHFFKI